MPGRLLTVLLGEDQWPNEEMMRSCNCSQPPNNTSAQFLISCQDRDNFSSTAMFGVNYNVSAITGNLRVAVEK